MRKDRGLIALHVVGALAFGTRGRKWLDRAPPSWRTDGVAYHVEPARPTWRATIRIRRGFIEPMPAASCERNVLADFLHPVGKLGTAQQRVERAAQAARGPPWIASATRFCSATCVPAAMN
jgi:hypothetical protein